MDVRSRRIPLAPRKSLKRYFLGFFGTSAFFGARAVNPADVDAMLEVMNGEIVQGFPDTFGFAGRAPIFGGSRGGRVIEVDLQAEEFEALLDESLDESLLCESWRELIAFEKRW